MRGMRLPRQGEFDLLVLVVSCHALVSYLRCKEDCNERPDINRVGDAQLACCVMDALAGFDLHAEQTCNSIRCVTQVQKVR